MNVNEEIEKYRSVVAESFDSNSSTTLDKLKSKVIETRVAYLAALKAFEKL